jgi:hypothetical protein
MIVQECGEVFAAMLERSFDGAQASPSHFGDFVNLVTVDAQFHDLALKRRQLLKGFLSDQTQKRHGRLAVRVFFGECIWVHSIDAARAANVSLGRSVERAASANLIECNHEQELPQIFAGRHVITAFTRGVKKIAEHRLDDVVWIESARQCSRTFSACQSAEPFGVTVVELASRFAIAALKTVQQIAIGNRQSVERLRRENIGNVPEIHRRCPS